MSNKYISQHEDHHGTVEDMDMTILDELSENCEGLDQGNADEMSNGERFASTMALRKNLSGAFDQYAFLSDDSHRIKDMNKRSSVKDKIEAFERATMNKISNSLACASQDSDSDVRRQPQQLHPLHIHAVRPPVPPTKTHINKTNSGRSSNNPSLLTVYLRVRPPTQRISGRGHSSDFINTIEMIKQTGDEQEIFTKIATYPPSSSNTAKVARGVNNHGTLPTTAHNSSSTLDSSGIMVKGVKEFEFTQVFPPYSSQQEIYEAVAAPLVDGLFPSQPLNNPKQLVGNSALLFAYGITNAGKTYTMLGHFPQSSAHVASYKVEDDYNAGIIPRSLSHILQTIAILNATCAPKVASSTVNGGGTIKDIQTPISTSYHLFLSYFEIYNEQIFDLLPHEKKLRPGQFFEESLKIRETRSGRTYVGGLAKHPVKDTATGIELLRSAMSKRRTSSNSINHDSSRSHSICQFELVAVTSHHSSKEGKLLDDDNASTASDSMGYITDDDGGMSDSGRPLPTRRSVNMWIVDLAGSERSKRTGFLPKASRQKESNLINTSLMKLMRCFQIIAENQKSSTSSSSLVPFRESKLTHLFMAHLTGTPVSRTSMIVNVNPVVDDYDETQHVLSYASVARNIRISEADYIRKRRAIQMINGDPRQISSSQGNTAQAADDVIKSPPRKISRLVQKLSPRALLAKRKQETSLKETHKDKEKTRVSDSSVSIPNTDLKGTEIKEVAHECADIRCLAAKKNLLEEKEVLRLQLDESYRLAEQYRLENDELSQKLDECESKVRLEIAEETEAQIIYIREQHNEIVHRLRQQYQNTTSATPSKSAKKAQSDKAAQMIIEYMEKIDECEDEMERMQNSHDAQIAQLNSLHKKELEAKDIIITDLQLKLSNVETTKRDEIANLEHALTIARDEIQILRKENEALAASLSSDQTEGIYDEDDPVARNKENLHDDSFRSITSPSTPATVRRLPRPRCSEVACSNISPNNMINETNPKQTSSSKKRQGLMSTMAKSKESRSPFKQLYGKSEFSDSLLEDNEILYPSSQPEYDEISGRYQRPRGRAPMGRTWDFHIGGWRRI